jgi:hypothetical protein
LARREDIQRKAIPLVVYQSGFQPAHGAGAWIRSSGKNYAWSIDGGLFGCRAVSRLVAWAGFRIKGSCRAAQRNSPSPAAAEGCPAWRPAAFPALCSCGSLLLFVQVLFSAEQLGFAVGPLFNMQVFYFLLFSAAFFSFILLGTNEVFQHYLLRLCLWLEGQQPLRLAPWLEAMQQRKVLQRVGGSYHFLHKQLQEYLAKSKVS